MKTITVILAMLILGLSMLPCTDGHTCEEEAGTSFASNHDHSQDENDLCSPFCVCACCGSIFTLEDLPIYDDLPALENITYRFHYSFLYAFSFINNIWRPPTFC